MVSDGDDMVSDGVLCSHPPSSDIHTLARPKGNDEASSGGAEAPAQMSQAQLAELLQTIQRLDNNVRRLTLPYLDRNFDEVFNTPLRLDSDASQGKSIGIVPDVDNRVIKYKPRGDRFQHHPYGGSVRGRGFGRGQGAGRVHGHHLQCGNFGHRERYKYQGSFKPQRHIRGSVHVEVPVHAAVLAQALPVAQGNQNASKACYICGSVDHRRRSCPRRREQRDHAVVLAQTPPVAQGNQSASQAPPVAQGNQNASKACYICGSVDHRLRNCPQRREQNGHTVVLVQTPPVAQDNQNALQAPPVAQGNQKASRTCYICGSIDHILQKCPWGKEQSGHVVVLAQTPPVAQGNQNASKACFICGSVKHIIRDCPRRCEQRGKRGKKGKGGKKPV